MTRNLTKWHDNGMDFLQKHPAYDLQSREVYEILKRARVKQGSELEAWNVLQDVFAIGIEAGRRMQLREAR